MKLALVHDLARALGISLSQLIIEAEELGS
jgi:hypothetical protein